MRQTKRDWKLREDDVTLRDVFIMWGQGRPTVLLPVIVLLN